MRNNVVLGASAVVLTAVAGYMLVISPQTASTGEVRTQLAAVRTSNAASGAQVPALKAQLGNITGSVAALRALSGQVPPVIDLPSLYTQLDAVAAKVGGGVKVTNVTFTVPALVTPAAAPVAPAATPATTPAPATATTPAGSPAVKAAAPASVLASYQVTMEVQATPAQTAAFLTALGQMPRMSVVTSTSLTAGAGGAPGTAHILATLFLQQVDVDALAAQIESLAAARSTSSPGAAPTAKPTSTPTDAPTDLPAPTHS
jgi:TolA-binding protein